MTPLQARVIARAESLCVVGEAVGYNHDSGVQALGRLREAVDAMHADGVTHIVWCVELRGPRGAVEFHEFDTGEEATSFAKKTPGAWRTFETHRHWPKSTDRLEHIAHQVDKIGARIVELERR